MDITLISLFEREFFLVCKTLDQLRQDLAGTDPLAVEIAQARHTLLTLMQAADCIDPTATLDGTGALGWSDAIGVG
jgi:hypothetical protein